MLENKSFSIPEGQRIYAVGDIHGQAELLAETLAAIEADARQHPDANITQVFLGDYIDRGMQSREVIDLLLAPAPTGHTRICLRGNHEATLLRFLNEPQILRDWASFGGYATLASYGIALPKTTTPETATQLRDALCAAMPPAQLTFLKSLKLSHIIGDYLFVHAGIDPQLAVASQPPEKLLWIREPFLSHTGYFSHYVVHGHTPVPNPEILHHRANLDVSGNSPARLACMVLVCNTRQILNQPAKKG